MKEMQRLVRSISLIVTVRNLPQIRFILPAVRVAQSFFGNGTAGAKVLPFAMSRTQTWNVYTHGLKETRVEHDHRATVPALNRAKIGAGLVFITGNEVKRIW
jgi:hypothetical protein